MRRKQRRSASPPLSARAWHAPDSASTMPCTSPFFFVSDSLSFSGAQIAFCLIPGVCGLAVTDELELKRRPLLRDVIFYTLGLALLVAFFHDGTLCILSCGWPYVEQYHQCAPCWTMWEGVRPWPAAGLVLTCPPFFCGALCTKEKMRCMSGMSSDRHMDARHAAGHTHAPHHAGHAHTRHAAGHTHAPHHARHAHTRHAAGHTHAPHHAGHAHTRHAAGHTRAPCHTGHAHARHAMQARSN